MATLSIVVPTHREEKGIQVFLEDLCKKSMAIEQCKVIVCDSGADDTRRYVLSMAEMNTVLQVISSVKGRARQMNRGAEQALSSAADDDSHYLLFVHSDTQLPDDIEQWWQRVQNVNPIWGFFRVQLSGDRWTFRMIEWFMNWRSRLTSVATGDQCLFVRGDIWRELGGFQSIALMEDIELSKRLRKLARPWVHQTPVATSSRRWEKRGIIRTVLLMWALRLGYFIGISPKHLARFYRS